MLHIFNMRWKAICFVIGLFMLCKAIESHVLELKPEEVDIHVRARREGDNQYDAANTCVGLSEQHGCTNCTEDGYCYRGFLPVDPWLEFALKTQREIQIDNPFDYITMFDGHNAYNSRADGYADYPELLAYGTDLCSWPPPYSATCWNFVNQEFTLTDLLNMGIRSLEIDNNWCFGAMRMSHVIDGALTCLEDNRLFEDGIQEIAAWLDIPENSKELILIYLNEKYDQGHDKEMNDPIALHLGDRVVTPTEYNETYNYQWPTMRQMRKDGKNVVFAVGGTGGTGEFYTHGDLFIHQMFWTDTRVSQFTAYPECVGSSKENIIRIYSDGTKYGPLWNGPAATGTILDFSEYMKCNVRYPAADLINPEMMKTGVFTWAEGEPSTELTAQSCVIFDGTQERWYVAKSCTEEQFFACQHTEDPHVWTLSTSAGPFSLQETYCPDGFKFSIPHDGFEQQKLLEVLNDATVWLDYSPWLPRICGSTLTSPGSISFTKYPEEDQYDLCPTAIRAPPGKQIRIVFNEFQLEGQKINDTFQCVDSLQLYNAGYEKQEKLMGEFCGDGFSFPIRSSGRNLFLLFSSVFATSVVGYKADITFEFAVRVQLRGGDSANEGRVQVSHSKYGKGTVCDRDWDVKDASVVCKMLGYGAAREATGKAYFGEGRGRVLVSNMHCSGLEYNIDDCEHSGWNQRSCLYHRRDAGVICYQEGEVPLAIRLAGGDDTNAGRVEVFIGGEWGTVCDDYWDLEDADVVCRSLGYPGAANAFLYGGTVPGDEASPIFFDNVDCNGDESGLEYCLHNGVGQHNCNHSKDVGVECRLESGVRVSTDFGDFPPNGLIAL